MIRRCHGASEEHVCVSLRLVFTCSVRRVRACCRGHLCGPHRNRLQIEGKLSLHPLRPNTHGANAHQIGSSGADVRVRRGAAVVLDERAGQWVARVAVTRVLTPIHTEARERHLCRNERQRGGMGLRCDCDGRSSRADTTRTLTVTKPSRAPAGRLKLDLNAGWLWRQPCAVVGMALPAQSTLKPANVGVELRTVR